MDRVMHSITTLGAAIKHIWQDRKEKYPRVICWGTILLAFAAALISARLLCGIVEISLFRLLLSHGSNGHTAALLAYMAQVVLIYDLTLILTVGAGLRLLGLTLDEIGWKKPDSIIRILASVICMVAFVFLGGIFVSLLRHGSFHGYTIAPSESLRNLGFASAYITLFVKVFNAPIEELFYRGFLQTALNKHLHASWTIVLTASFFAVAHLESNKSITQVFIAGLIYSILRKWGNTLWNPIAAHLTKNSIASYVSITFQ